MSRKHYSAFAKPYTVILSTLKKEQEEKFKAEHVDVSFDTAYYPDYLFDLSDGDLNPISATHHYKKSHAIKHKYNFEKPLAMFSHRKQNYFKELEIFLPSLLDESPFVNDDFLTGYYFAKALVIPNIIENRPNGVEKTIKSFHPGLSSDGITKGIWYAFADYNKKHTKDSIHWEFFGCDSHIKPIYKTKYLNGVTRKCDIFHINSIRSIGIQIEEKVKKIHLLITDIKPTGIKDIVSQLILAHDTVENKGIAIIRINIDWLAQYTQMINILIYCISSYNIVKIFKTPWGNTPRLYLILLGVKRKALTAPHKTGLIKYYEALDVDTKAPLFNKMIFNIEDKTEISTEEGDIDETPDKLAVESYMTQVKENLAEKYKQIVSYDMKFETPELCSSNWLSQMFESTDCTTDKASSDDRKI